LANPLAVGWIVHALNTRPGHDADAQTIAGARRDARKELDPAKRKLRTKKKRAHAALPPPRLRRARAKPRAE